MTAWLDVFMAKCFTFVDKVWLQGTWCWLRCCCSLVRIKISEHEINQTQEILSWYAILRSLPKDRSTGKVIELNDIYFAILRPLAWKATWLSLRHLGTGSEQSSFKHLSERLLCLSTKTREMGRVRNEANKMLHCPMRRLELSASHAWPWHSCHFKMSNKWHTYSGKWLWNWLISWTFKWLAFAGKGTFQHQALFLIHLSKATVLNCLHESFDLSN